MPGSHMIPAGHAVRASLALKLWSIERKSHVMALLGDDGFGLFAGLYYEQTVTLAGRRLRQLYLQDLGHDEPTILPTNAHRTSPKALITRYARRMLIEHALSDAVRFFHMDALSSAVGLKVDFDMTMLVVASGLYRLLAGRLRGYGDAQARQIFRDLVAMPATITVTETDVEVSFPRRSHLPIRLVSGLMGHPVAVPWWSGRRLRLTTYNGPTQAAQA